MTTQNRQPVLRCVLSNAAHPEYGQVTIPFPIPVMEYERTLELLAAMELGARLKRDCRVDELESGFPILKRLEKVGANLDELDYLARRLDGFDDYEAAQFQAMAVRLGTFDMTDFINLTFCGQQATVITDFSDLDAVGRQHYMTLEGGCASEEELEQVDGRAAALKLILNKHGTITPYGVVYADPPYLEAERMYAPSFALRDHVRLHDCLCAPAARDSHIVLSYNSHPDILDLFAPDFYIVGFDRPNPMARQEDSRYHELLMTNFDPSPMLNRQLSLLDNPGLVSSDRPELRILSAPTGRLPRVWDWPQD